MPRARRGVLVSALAAAWLVLAGHVALCAPAKKEAALDCPAPSPQPFPPNAMRGVVSRIEINPEKGPGVVSSVNPALANLDLVAWVRNLEQSGVNMAQLYLQPDVNLAQAPLIDTKAWHDYLDAALLPYSRMTPAQRDAYKTVRDRITGRNGARVSAEQQIDVHLAFLARLEALKNEGKICGSVQFIVVERRWFLTARDPIPDPPLRRQFDNEEIYARTMADFLNKAAYSGLDHWLAGIMVAEYTNTSMNQILPLTVDLATRINGLTHNWLRSHLMEMAGGGFGNQFAGIDGTVCPANADRADSGYQFTCKPGQPFDFFGLITRQTGTFSFAYKAFNWKNAPTPASYCNGCDPKSMSVVDWTGYLSDPGRGLGFSDLASFVNRNAATYPQAANVTFIGNASDNIFKMVEVVNDAAGSHLEPKPQLIALESLFRSGAQKGGGWSGRMFMDAYADRDRRSTINSPSVDDGTSLFFVDAPHLDLEGKATVVPNPQSQAFWRAWPQLPPRR
jgi:hypothetical protein